MYQYKKKIRTLTNTSRRRKCYAAHGGQRKNRRRKRKTRHRRLSRGGAINELAEFVFKKILKKSNSPTMNMGAMLDGFDLYGINSTTISPNDLARTFVA